MSNENWNISSKKNAKSFRSLAERSSRFGQIWSVLHFKRRVKKLSCSKNININQNTAEDFHQHLKAWRRSESDDGQRSWRKTLTRGDGSVKSMRLSVAGLMVCRSSSSALAYNTNTPVTMETWRNREKLKVQFGDDTFRECFHVGAETSAGLLMQSRSTDEGLQPAV